MSIEKPKVFISYAWTDADYQRRVIQFSEDLVKKGIDVMLDVWDLKTGQDMFKFMESCVNDTSITNVLLLLNEEYQIKADERQGGAGAETTIISVEVYQNAEQTKFLPIVFDRDDEGKVCSPTYLKSRIYIDLSRDESYDEEFIKLVNILYGEEINIKPEIGEKPDWVGKTDTIQFKFEAQYKDFYRKLHNPNLNIKNNIAKFFEEFVNQVFEFFDEGNEKTQEDNYYWDKLEKSKFYRNYFINVFELITNQEIELFVGDFIEKLISKIKYTHSAHDNINLFFVYELFLYILNVLFNQKSYSQLNKLLIRQYSRFGDTTQFEHLFTSDYYGILAMLNRRDGKEYYSPAAKLISERASLKSYTITSLAFVDSLVFNIGVICGFYWFPLLYLNLYYSGNPDFDNFAKKLISKSFFESISPLFNGMELDVFRKEISKTSEFTRIAYPRAYYSAPLLLRYIELDKIGSKP